VGESVDQRQDVSFGWHPYVSRFSNTHATVHNQLSQTIYILPNFTVPSIIVTVAIPYKIDDIPYSLIIDLEDFKRLL
jgi:hypothetical protein